MSQENIPGPIKFAAGLLGIGVPVGIATTSMATGNYALLWALVVFLILLGMGAGFYYLWRKSQQKKSDSSLKDAVSSASDATPFEINQADARIELDGLRKKFQKGIDEFKRRGKSMYDTPWFLLVGESGAGKTQAVKKATLQPIIEHEEEGMAGVGGTVNMNWWFMEEAIILDTAGKMVFTKVPAGQTSQWKEFLELLKRNRPYAPINGLLLTVPVTSLLADNPAAIETKAKTIFAQLDLLQRTLDVRFPVYLLVTKCDYIPGFRQCFEEINDIQKQYQMVGWSNKNDLDKPFEPSEVPGYISAIAERLRKRVLLKLRDPLPQDPTHRRIDEVDEAYAFPQQFESLGPKIKAYTEVIFRRGTWALPPLFLRGIYFTSSLTANKALDVELLKALGRQPRPEDAELSIFEKSRPLFLRDFFREKVFKETGLVTAASNVRKMLMRQKMAWYGVGLGCLAVLATLFIVGRVQIQKSILEETGYWAWAAQNGWQLPYWNPIVEQSGAQFNYRGTNLLPTLNRSATLDQFHPTLQTLVAKPMRLGIFRPLGGLTGIEDKRADAQETLMELGVVDPLVDFARQKIKNDTIRTHDGSALQRKRQANVLGALIGIEAQLQQKAGAMKSPEEAHDFLSDFVPYLTESDFHPGTGLVQSLYWDYSSGPGRQSWPPVASGGTNLQQNEAISKGLKLFTQNVEGNRTELMARLQALQHFTNGVHIFKTTEDQMHQRAMSNQPIQKIDLDRLVQGAKSISEGIYQLTQQKIGMAPGKAFSITKAFADLRSDFQSSLNDFDYLNKVLTNAQGPLFSEIKTEIAKAKENLLQPGRFDTNILDEFDRHYVSPPVPNSKPAFEQRAAIYAAASALFDKRPFQDAIGDKWEKYKKWNNDYQALAGHQGSYQGELKDKMQLILKQASEEIIRVANSTFQPDFLVPLKKEMDHLQSEEVLGSNDEAFEVPDLRARLDQALATIRKWQEDVSSAGVLTQNQQVQLNGLAREFQPLEKLLHQKFLYQLNNSIAVNFPLTTNKTGRPPMTFVDILRTAEHLQKVSAELKNSLAGPALGIDASAVQRRVARLQQIVHFLVDPTGQPRRVIVTWPSQPQRQEGDVAIREYRIVRVNSQEPVFVNKSMMLAELGVNDAFAIEFGRRTEVFAADKAFRFEEWGPVQLLAFALSRGDQSYKPINAETVLVTLPIEGTGGRALMYSIELKFKDAGGFPNLREWFTGE